MAKNKNHGLRDKLNQRVPDSVNVLRDFGVTLDPKQRQALTWGDLMEHQAIQSGCRGNSKVLADTMDRVYGKVPQVNKNENMNMSLSYQDVLDKIAADEKVFIASEVELPEESSEEVDPLAEFL